MENWDGKAFLLDFDVNLQWNAYGISMHNEHWTAEHMCTQNGDNI